MVAGLPDSAPSAPRNGSSQARAAAVSPSAGQVTVGADSVSRRRNTSTRGDWTLSISTPVGTLSSNILYAFIVYADSDAQAVVTANNKVYDLRPRSVSARNYTVVDENGNVITLLTRTESER